MERRTNCACIQQVAAVRLGNFSVDMTEDKLRVLWRMSRSAAMAISLIAGNSEKLIRLAADYDGIDEDIMDVLRMLIDIKDDYTALQQMGIEQEGGSNE